MTIVMIYSSCIGECSVELLSTNLSELFILLLDRITFGLLVATECGEINGSEVDSEREVVLAFDFDFKSFTSLTSKARQS